MDRLEKVSLDTVSFLRFKLKITVDKGDFKSCLVIYEKLLDLGIDEGWNLAEISKLIPSTMGKIDFSEKLLKTNIERLDEVKHLVYIKEDSK